ncbi:hypothetical protein BDR06DRAFT_1061875 [Suillus hirtellus]|nr:hypothetical protein BDR06DRAFT_1061875 [Suillus hirtellus]
MALQQRQYSTIIANVDLLEEHATIGSKILRMQKVSELTHGDPASFILYLPPASMQTSLRAPATTAKLALPGVTAIYLITTPFPRPRLSIRHLRTSTLVSVSPSIAITKPQFVAVIWYYHKIDLHWNSGAKTATATVEHFERQYINIKTYGKHLTISRHLKRSENHKKGGYTVQQHFYGKLWRLHRPG